MKVNVRRDKKTGETFALYGARFSIEKYRYLLLKKIIESGSSAMLFVDSNQKTGEGNLKEAEEFLKRAEIKYSAFQAKQNNTVFFGFEIPSKKINQVIIIMEITGEQFSRELYDAFLKRYDLAIGIGRLKPFEETCDILRMELSKVLFNTEYFKESVYDSAVCGTIRSSIDIEPYIEAAINETAI